ncbi:TIGR03943 family putative permease subunit [Cylindrospermum sp. FACHB-282]|uniref:TIGR03943 family putative permease subunit n=1 Tax=Cylindrospermum sp. FACHB-282 TaxID=2692794 RepID=UPI001687CB8B|nr:TIGR03943 family protein [Cylindrospermum sp. FACHB-282]MBD2384867.1 TIGR03943 family protein [Cylindrospermum sp. FACHB-282]
MTSIQNPKSKIQNILLPWLDVFAIGAWGVLILKYWLTGKLNLLIHPDYFWLAISGGFGLLIVGLSKAWQLWVRRRRYDPPSTQHFSLFPPGWGSALLLTAAILGLMITPRVFASDKALQGGVTELMGATRAQPQAFRATIRPEERSLVDWVRTLNVYPEPDAYAGQKVKVQGFVIHPPDMSKDHLFLARFVITCCAADAYPAGLPVKLTGTRDQYPPDIWLEVEGQMVTENLLGKRQLTIAANSLKTIPQPKNPYTY